jgi:hypothetical protein
MRMSAAILASLSLAACARSRTTLQAPPQPFASYGALQLGEVRVDGAEGLSAEHRSLADATAVSVRTRLRRRMEGSVGVFKGGGPALSLRVVLRGFAGEAAQGIVADASFVDAQGQVVARVEACGDVSRRYYAGEVAVTARRVADAVWDFVLEHDGVDPPGTRR